MKKIIKKPGSLRSQFLIKKGGYSLAITALVLAALIILNWLVSTLSDRFHLEYDISPDKINSMDSDNIKYIESIEDEVVVTVCSAKDTYASNMDSYAESYYGISDGHKYYENTVTLLDKYRSYSKKIKIEYIDPQSVEFTAVSQEYPNINLVYGDVIVSCEKNGNKRYKRLDFSDIYSLYTDETYSAYGYTVSSITGNNIESALTSAIAYCISQKTSTAMVLTGHSSTDYSSGYVELLKANNFEVDVFADNVINDIPDSYDIVVIMAPTGDFLDDEIKALESFLDSGKGASKGIMYFADPTSPSLPNLEGFLSQWGIDIEEGLLFETYSGNTMGDPVTMGMYPNSSENEQDEFDSSIISDIDFCLTGYNVPLKTGTPTDSLVKVNAVMNTLETVVVAPVGASASWDGYTDSDKAQYQSVIESKKLYYNAENEPITSYIYAFGSVEYIQSEWAENSRVSNKNLVLACTERASGSDNGGMQFVTKKITNESYSDSVTESSTRVIRIIFMFIIPILTVAAGIFVYIRRRNC